MSEKILASKIQIPIRLKNFIPRDELLELLKGSSEKVVVLNAGAGYGKTMLLTYYCVETAEKCAWYHLSSFDNDIMNFIKYLSSSLNRVINDFKFVYINPGNKCGNELIESIAYEFAIYLSQFSEDNISILLDDFQEIYDEAIYNFLSIVLNNTNNNIRFFIATKGSFPKFLARFLMQGSAMVINEKKLVFNKNEIKELLNDIKIINDIDSCTELILDYTEGWPAGVIAITLSLKNERKSFDRDEIITLCKESKVYDYFMYEIFKKLPYDIQNFLIHTSVLNILSADLCNAVMNNTTAKSILDYLVQENIFIVMLSGKGNVYRYHSIFKDYLNMQINENIRQEVLKKASLYCLNKGDYEQAVEYAILCSDFDLMQSGFELIGMKMLEQGEMLILNRWVEFLNNRNSEYSPKTKMVMSSYYYCMKELQKAFELIDGACMGFENENNENEYVDASLQKVGYLEDQGDYTGCLQEITSTLVFIKRKYNSNWYAVSYRKMELCLLMINETEAVSTAEEIKNGSTLLIRGGKELVVNNLKVDADLVYKIGRSHLRGDMIEPEEEVCHSRIVYCYMMWCRIQSLYLMHQYDTAFNQILLFFKDIRINNVFTGYINILHSLFLLYRNELEEAASIISKIDIYFDQYDLEYLRFSKEDIKLLKDTFKFASGRKGSNKLTSKCFENGITYVERPAQEIKWRTKKTYEMFAFLFDRQGKPVSRDTIVGVLWPEMSVDKATTLFHTTLSYMRKALAEQNLSELIHNNNNRYALTMDNLDTDYALLMDIYQKVQAGKFEELCEAQKLVELYKNSYFENISSEWVISKREHLERVYILCCRSIAEYMLSQRQYNESTVLLTKVVKLDPYSEELLALIMKAYGALGEIKTVKGYYEESKRVLKTELDLEPSDEIEKLYNEIIRRKK